PRQDAVPDRRLVHVNESSDRVTSPTPGVQLSALARATTRFSPTAARMSTRQKGRAVRSDFRRAPSRRPIGRHAPFVRVALSRPVTFMRRRDPGLSAMYTNGPQGLQFIWSAKRVETAE